MNNKYTKALKELKLSTSEASKETNKICLQTLQEALDLLQLQESQLQQSVEMISDYDERGKRINQLEKEIDQHKNVIKGLFSYMSPHPNGTSVQMIQELLKQVGMKIK